MGIKGLVEISYHESVTNLQALWGKASSPFERADWFALLDGAAKQTPTYALAQSDEGVAILPLIQDGSRVSSFTNWYSFQWLPVVRASKSAELLTALLADLKSKTARLTLAPLPEEDSIVGVLVQALRAAGWTVFASNCDTNHILEVDDRDYAAYLAGRPGKLRTTLKRKGKKVEIEIVERYDEDLWAAYEDVYADSWKPEEGAPAMLKAFAEQEGAAGRIRLAVALHGGEAIAAQFWTVESGVAYIHKLAHRKDATKISPGTSLTAALLEYVIDKDKVRMVDFGTGDDPYKRDWMEKVRQRVQLECFVASSPSNWPAIAKRMVHNLA